MSWWSLSIGTWYYLFEGIRCHGESYLFSGVPTAGREEITLNWIGKEAGTFVPDGIYTYAVGMLVAGEEVPFFTRKIEVDNTAPQDPILLYPADEVTITNLGLMLKWESVSDAAYYLVALGQNEDLTEQEPLKQKSMSWLAI